MAGQSTTTSSSAPSWALPYWGSYLDGAAQQSQKPLQQYQGPQVADFSPEQYDAMGMITDRAKNGSALTNSVGGALQGMFGTNGYGGYSGLGTGGGSSLYGAGSEGGQMAQIQLGRNPLMDSNPYLEEILKRTGADTARDYATGTAAQNDSRAARAGAFGGSAYEEVNRANAASLADRIAGAGTQMRYADFNDRRGLEEAALQRELEAKQTQMQTSAQKFAAGASAGASRANALGAQQLDAMRMAMELGNQPYADADKLMGVGSLRQMYSQNLIDADRGQFNEGRAYPQQQLDNFGNAISRATGGQSTQTSQVNTQTNPWATALGGGLSLAAMYGYFNGK